jgi:predicted TIM-barrel fold metal-dependent hydrolase
MKVDVHAHFVNRDFYDALERLPGISVRDAGDGRTELRRGPATFMWRKDDWFLPEHCLADMDLKGIDMRLLSLSAPNVHSFPGESQVKLARALNDALLKKCEAAPDRLRGLCSLPLADIEGSLEELERVRGHELFAGIAMGSSLDAIPLNHRKLEPVWVRLDALAIPVVEHPMHPANTTGLDEYELPIRVGFIYETTTALTRMIYGGVFERYSEFSLCRSAYGRCPADAARTSRQRLSYLSGLPARYLTTAKLLRASALLRHLQLFSRYDLTGASLGRTGASALWYGLPLHRHGRRLRQRAFDFQKGPGGHSG